MLKITVGEQETFNEETMEFHKTGGASLVLEHSLVSMSKWESIYEKPFLSKTGHTTEEILHYIECMVISPTDVPNLRELLDSDTLEMINQYINSKQTATTFSEMPGQKRNNEVITSELMYYWMLSFNIPFECQYWHVNRLFALIQICSIKNSKQKKIPRNEIAARNRELNAKRRAQLGTSG
jgi:hypothetical protein